MQDRTELQNRGHHLNISKFSAGRGCSVIIAILFGGWGIGLVYLLAINHGMSLEELKIPVFLFALCLIFGALALIRATFKKPEHNFNLSFNERDLLKKARLPNLFFLVIILIFCSLFIGVGIFGKEIMFLIGGLFFLLLFVSVGIHGFLKNEKKIKLTKTHGTTHLVANSVLSLGNTCAFIIQNNSPDLQAKEVQVNLRFVEEIYISEQRKRKKKARKLKIFYSSLQQLNTSLENGESKSFQFTLPRDGQLTDMDFKEPKYWELTCSIEELDYFSRFILDVKS